MSQKDLHHVNMTIAVHMQLIIHIMYNKKRVIRNNDIIYTIFFRDILKINC